MKTKDEEQIRFIHEQYELCGLGEIPPCLEVNFQEKYLGLMTEVQAKNPTRENNFESTRVNAATGNGPLKSYAEDMITKICDYQKTRNSRL